jgi:hypothetical protein
VLNHHFKNQGISDNHEGNENSKNRPFADYTIPEEANEMSDYDHVGDDNDMDEGSLSLYDP